MTKPKRVRRRVAHMDDLLQTHEYLMGEIRKLDARHTALVKQQVEAHATLETTIWGLSKEIKSVRGYGTFSTARLEAKIDGRSDWLVRLHSRLLPYWLRLGRVA